MVCGKCGHNNEGNVNFCSRCGNQMNALNNGQVNSVPVSNNQVSQNVPNQTYVNPSMPQQQYYNNQQNVYYQRMMPIQPKKSNAILIVIIVLLFCALVGLGVFLEITLLKDNEVVEDEVVITSTLDIDVGKRTILIYMIGSNLESESGEATEDLDEMIKSNFDTKALNVVVYTGGSKKWKNDVIKNDENAIYEVTSDGLNKVKTYSQKSMTKSSTLTEFIDYVYDNYKTDLYDLILWDHGGGPIYGYGSDEFDSNSYLSIAELNVALDNSKLLKDTKFEWIGFDACLMASVEIANVLKEEANYFIASEEVIPAYGWDYSFLREVKTDLNTEDLGRYIVDYYGSFYDSFNASAKIYALYGYNLYQNYTLSLMDLSKVDTLIKEIDSSFSNLSSGVTSTTFNLLAINTTRTTIYGCFTDDVCYNLVDLYSLAGGISSQISNYSRLQQAVRDVVVHEKNNIDGSNGISIYFPIRNKEYASQFNPYYEKLNFSSNYYNFIKSYTSLSSGDSFIKTNTKSISPSVNKNVMSVNLEDDLANNYLKGDFSIFVENEYDGYFPVYRGYDVKLNDNVLSTTPIKKELVITNGKGKEESFAMSFEYEKDENSTTYLVLAALQDSRDISNFKVESVIFYVRFKNGSSEGEIVDIKPCDSKSGTLSKKTYNLNDWSHVISMSGSYQLDDKDGNALQEWDVSDTTYGTEYNIRNDGFKFVLKDFDKSKKYYYVFRMEDTQGIKHVFKKIEAK